MGKCVGASVGASVGLLVAKQLVKLVESVTKPSAHTHVYVVPDSLEDSMHRVLSVSHSWLPS